jgi:hypothetical protein
MDTLTAAKRASAHRPQVAQAGDALFAARLLGASPLACAINGFCGAPVIRSAR